MKNNKFINLLIFSLSFLIIWFSLKRIFDINIFNEKLLIDNYFTYIIILLFGIFSNVNNKNYEKINPVYILLIILSAYIGNIIGFNYIFQGITFSLVLLFLVVLILNKYKFFNLKLGNIYFNSILIVGYSLSSGSILHSLIICILYDLGFFLSKYFKEKNIFKFISLLLEFILIFVMFNRILFTFKEDKCVDINSTINSIIADDYQYVDISLEDLRKSDIMVQKSIPLKIILKINKLDLSYYNDKIVIKEYDIDKKLDVGENIIEFTPEKEETIIYNTWMNMIKSKIKVIDDINCFINENTVCSKEC